MPGNYVSKGIRKRTVPNKDTDFDATLECNCVLRFHVKPHKGEHLYCYRHPNRYQVVTKVSRVFATALP